MRVRRTARRLTLYVAERDTGAGGGVDAVIHDAARLGLDGASLFAGLTSFGSAHHLHVGGLLHRPDETPLILIIVDDEERIAALLPSITENLPNAFGVFDDVDAIRYLPPEHLRRPVR